MYLTIFARFPNHHEYQCASMTFSTTRHVFSGRVGRGCVSIGHVYFKKLHSQREQCSMYRVLFLFYFLKAISIEYIYFSIYIRCFLQLLSGWFQPSISSWFLDASFFLLTFQLVSSDSSGNQVTLRCSYHCFVTLLGCVNA